MRMTRIPSLIAAGLLAAFTTAPAWAADGPIRLRLGYDGRFYVKVLEMSLDEDIDAAGYRTSAHIQTWGLGAVVKKLDQRASASGRVEGARTLPGRFTQQNLDGKRNRRVTVTWGAGDVVTASSPAYDFMGDPPASRAQKLAAADPLTQFVRITRASSQEGPCSTDTHFFDGKQLYDFDFASPRPSGAPDAREQGLGLINMTTCDVRFREVAGFKAKPPEQRSQGLKGAIAARFGQLGPGGPWLLSSLQADTRWGRAVIDLRRLSTDGAALAD
jgi:hypothetical protein